MLFDAFTYQARRDRLMQAVENGLILLPGNHESPMNCTDNTYPFRQDSSFLYFTGISQPGLSLVMDADTGKSWLFGDDQSLEAIVWMGKQPTMAELARTSGIAEVRPSDELGQFIRHALDKGRKVHYTPPYRHDNIYRLSRWLEIGADLLKIKASARLVDAIVAQRSVKNEIEIRELERAVNITGAMHLAAMKHARPGTTEGFLAGTVEGIAGAYGAGLAYPVILTINGHILHNHYHGNTLREGQLVLGDFGAQSWNFYAGDITRTYPVAATFSSRQKDVYQIVLEAEMACIQALRPGIPYKDIHLMAARIIFDGLKDLGITRGDTGEAVAAGAHALFFPHGLGHMLGLDVHDMEDLGEDRVGYDASVTRSPQFGLKSLRLARPLREGFVLTVEPGIYFIPDLIDIWAKENRFVAYIDYQALEPYRDFSGIRIEDNVLITADGHRILGDPIPKTVEDVEEVRKEALES